MFRRFGVSFESESGDIALVVMTVVAGKNLPDIHQEIVDDSILWR